MRNSPWGEAGSSPTHVVGGQGGDNKHHSEDFVTDARALPIAFLSISEGRGEVLPMTPRLLLEPHNLGENGDSLHQAGMRRRWDGGPGCWVPAPPGRGEPGHAREGTPIPGCLGGCCIPAGWLSCPGGCQVPTPPPGHATARPKPPAVVKPHHRLLITKWAAQRAPGCRKGINPLFHVMDCI